MDLRQWDIEFHVVALLRDDLRHDGHILYQLTDETNFVRGLNNCYGGGVGQ